GRTSASGPGGRAPVPRAGVRPAGTAPHVRPPRTGPRPVRAPAYAQDQVCRACPYPTRRTGARSRPAARPPAALPGGSSNVHTVDGPIRWCATQGEGNPVTGWLQALDRRARLRARAGLTRTLRPRPATDATIDLAGNDYLGLSRHPEVVAAAA